MARNKYDIDERLESEFNINHLKRIFKYVKPYKKKMLLTLFFMVISTSASLLGPYLIKDALDNRIPQNDIYGLVILAILFTLILVVIAICSRFRMDLINNVGQNIIRDIRLDLFKHLQTLPFSYYDSRPHGKIYVRVVNYVNAIGNLISNRLVQVVIDVISLIFIAVIMFSINVKLSLLSFLGLPLLISIVFLIKSRQRKAWQDVSAKRSNLNAYVHESISGIKVTQAYTREDVNLDILGDLGEKFRVSWMKAVGSNFVLGPSVEIIAVMVTCLIYMAGVSWIAGGVSLGVMIAFTNYTNRFWGPINNLSNFYNQIITSMAYLERVFETMDEKPIVTDAPGAYEIPPIAGTVEFKDVMFCYDKGGKLILNNVSFFALLTP